MILGIDLHNIRDGGGVNYIVNLLNAFDPYRDGFNAIHVWGSREILRKIPERICIVKHHHWCLERSLIWRIIFNVLVLNKELQNSGCDLLYSPGGIRIYGSLPFVTISRNMMPFDVKRWQLYKQFSFDRVRLILLRWIHSYTFKRADGMIYLTQFAKSQIEKYCPRDFDTVEVIHHGVNHHLFVNKSPRQHSQESACKKKVKIIYPSRLEPYKHQIEVIKAVSQLRECLGDIQIDMVGPINRIYLCDVLKTIQILDPKNEYIRYLGNFENKDLPELYSRYDILVFASSCENLPNTLIEAMAFGIPILCSRSQPMPEIAQESCIYFDPEDVESIKAAFMEIVLKWESTKIRVLAGKSIAQQYSWEKCARQTFQFLKRIVKKT
jgi:glycosyltransferase involved in cell wall biosynthesis